ncbi:MAG TPA: 16S rRNA (cytidine(1402)-2'-O)-methyltransferase, partial [Pseudomonadales bacterium]|nr:16S rRNA (cytidine(1402)-2'-O)-methyltransferase [Pseudomonadales bacterium]
LLKRVQADPNQQKGEMVLLVGPAPKKEKATELDAGQLALLKRLLEDLPPKKAAAVLADVFTLNKKSVYAAAIELKGAGAE